MTLRPWRSKARLVRTLIVPAGALASTSALIVLATSIESIPLSDICSKLKLRDPPAPVLTSAAARFTPLTMTWVYAGGNPRSCTLRTVPSPELSVSTPGMNFMNSPGLPSEISP